MKKTILKLFLYRDKTGRGIKETLTAQQLKTWKERNYDGETLTEWLQECEEGDKWENAATEIIAIN